MNRDNVDNLNIQRVFNSSGSIGSVKRSQHVVQAQGKHRASGVKRQQIYTCVRVSSLSNVEHDISCEVMWNDALR